MLGLFFKGILLGFSIAMPVGPIGILCIGNCLNFGLRYGLMTGLGAAVADMLYGSIAGLGLTTLMTFMLGMKLWLQIGGGLFLCYLGFTLFRANTATSKTQTNASAANTFYTTFFLTLTNPMTILSFLAMYAGFANDFESNGYLSTLILSLGVFTGSMLWWCLLSFTASFYRHSFTTKWLNRISGSFLMGFGVTAFFI
ncbi:MAG: LysE family translocator [Chlamydiales bacterium]|nr:LysE family translocator [Chlamydiales bacterium]